MGAHEAWCATQYAFDEEDRSGPPPVCDCGRERYGREGAPHEMSARERVIATWPERETIARVSASKSFWARILHWLDFFRSRSQG